MKRNNKQVVGITGGSGCGKSYLCRLLNARGYDIIDTDVIAREVMKKGQKCLLETAQEFGEDILNDGVLDRKKLAKIVFSDEKKLKKLNEISHKYILAKSEEMIASANSDTVFVDGAVLLESGFECDYMIGVLAEPKERMARIIERDTLTEEEAKRRIQAQPGDDFYIQNCDFVVYNNGDGFDVDAILKRIGI